MTKIETLRKATNNMTDDEFIKLLSIPLCRYCDKSGPNKECKFISEANCLESVKKSLSRPIT